MKGMVFAIALIALASPAAAADCSVQVRDAFIAMPPSSAGVAAAYFTLTNDCEVPAVLIGAEADAADSLSLHRTSIEAGIARMKPVGRVAIEPNSSIEFAPGGLHVMLHGAELTAGQFFPFDLVLENGARVSVRADIVHRARAAHPHHNKHHSGAVE